MENESLKYAKKVLEWYEYTLSYNFMLSTYHFPILYVVGSQFLFQGKNQKVEKR